MENINLMELAEKSGEFSIESKLNYLIYETITGKLNNEDILLLNNINKFFSEAGDEGVNFENFMLYTKLNIYAGRKEIYEMLIEQIENQLSQNLLLPEDDIFSIYKGVSILESLADKTPLALDHVKEIISMISDSSVDISPLLEGISSNVVDNIHLREGNLYLLKMIDELSGHLKEQYISDKFWSSTLSKLILRKEDVPTLNENIIKYVEDNLDKISKDEEKLGIYYGLCLTYYERWLKSSAEESMKKLEFYEKKLRESLSPRAPQISKLYREVLFARLLAKEGKEISGNLKIIKEREKNILKTGNKESIDAASYIIVTGLSNMIINYNDKEGIIKNIMSSLDNASEIVKLWGLIDLYTKLKSFQNAAASKIMEEILISINNLGEEKHEIIEDWLTNGLAESFVSNPDQEILELLVRVSEMDGQHTEEILANFFSSLSYFAEVNRHILNFSS